MITENTSSEPACEFWHGTRHLRYPVTTGAMGPACVISVLVRRPLSLVLARQADPGGDGHPGRPGRPTSGVGASDAAAQAPAWLALSYRC
jgi:hypothetical protein